MAKRRPPNRKVIIFRPHGPTHMKKVKAGDLVRIIALNKKDEYYNKNNLYMATSAARKIVHDSATHEFDGRELGVLMPPLLLKKRTAKRRKQKRRNKK